MYLNESMASYQKKCEKNIEKLEAALESMPEGSLRISRTGKYYSWRVKYPNEKCKYLPKSEEALAVQLAKKAYYEAQLHDLKIDAEACGRFLRMEKGSVQAVEKLFESATPEYRRLLGATILSDNEKISAWEKESYKKYDKYQEALICTTLKEGERVRSKLESIAAGILYTLKIPYKYEKLTKIGDVEIAVDFTALDVRTFQEIPIEFFGMMDDLEYVKNYRRKMNTYISNGYIPGVNMLTFYESKNAPLNQVTLKKKLEDFFFHEPPIQL